MATLRQLAGLAVVALSCWIVACTAPAEKPALLMDSDLSFACTLDAESPLAAGSAVNVRFTLQNQGKNRLYVLNWYTPLEGLKGEIFRVTRDGQEIPYTGMMVKRGDPMREDYVTLEPGAEVAAEVDLATAYDLSAAGAYHLAFTSRLNDVVRDEGAVPRKQNDHRPVDLDCNALDITITRQDG